MTARTPRPARFEPSAQYDAGAAGAAICQAIVILDQVTASFAHLGALTDEDRAMLAELRAARAAAGRTLDLGVAGTPLPVPSATSTVAPAPPQAHDPTGIYDPARVYVDGAAGVLLSATTELLISAHVRLLNLEMTDIDIAALREQVTAARDAVKRARDIRIDWHPAP